MRQRPTGFTLIELMVTLAILALMASIVLPIAEVTVQRQKEQELRLALRDIRTAIDAYKRASDEGRITRAINASGYPANLDVLVKGVIDARDPKGRKIYFLRRVPRDPFFSSQETPASETWGMRSYASEADSPQAGDDVFDVFSLSEQLALNGTPIQKW